MRTLVVHPMLVSLVRKGVSQPLKAVTFSVARHAMLNTTTHRLQAQIIDGKLMARAVQSEIRSQIDEWLLSGHRRPHLTAILVGSDPASTIYVRNKIKAAELVGITSNVLRLPDTITEAELLSRIHVLNSDHAIDGILVQLPVPPHISERRVCNAVAPQKDVDGFHIANVGRLCVNQRALVPATPAAVVEIIKRAGIQTFGKNAVVCGRSKNVGLPIALMLHADGMGDTEACDATTVICHRNTPAEQLRVFTQQADILVVATGIPGLIKPDMVKDGVAVIDVGITEVRDSGTGRRKLVGDVQFEGVVEKASLITPVPGGVGPMTVAMLMKNTLVAARREIVYSNDELQFEGFDPQNNSFNRPTR